MVRMCLRITVSFAGKDRPPTELQRLPKQDVPQQKLLNCVALKLTFVMLIAPPQGARLPSPSATASELPAVSSEAGNSRKCNTVYTCSSELFWVAGRGGGGVLWRRRAYQQGVSQWCGKISWNLQAEVAGHWHRLFPKLLINRFFVCYSYWGWVRSVLCRVYGLGLVTKVLLVSKYKLSPLTL